MKRRVILIEGPPYAGITPMVKTYEAMGFPVVHEVYVEVPECSSHTDPIVQKAYIDEWIRELRRVLGNSTGPVVSDRGPLSVLRFGENMETYVAEVMERLGRTIEFQVVEIQ